MAGGRQAIQWRLIISQVDRCFRVGLVGSQKKSNWKSNLKKKRSIGGFNPVEKYYIYIYVVKIGMFPKSG